MWNSHRDPFTSLVCFIYKKRSCISQYFSTNYFVPDFALSALKNSFSMSSLSQTGSNPEGAGTLTDLQPLAAQRTPDVNARLKWERPFNSLTRLK